MSSATPSYEPFNVVQPSSRLAANRRQNPPRKNGPTVRTSDDVHPQKLTDEGTIRAPIWAEIPSSVPAANPLPSRNAEHVYILMARIAETASLQPPAAENYRILPEITTWLARKW